MHARIENVFHFPEATFWDVLFFDHEYNARLHRELGFQTYEVRALEELPDGKVRRALRCEPPLKVPAMLKKRIQSRVFYEEEGVYDRNAKRWEFSSTSTVMPESASSSELTRLPLATSQNNATLSSLVPEASTSPSGRSASAPTEPSCPFHSPAGSPPGQVQM